MVITHTLLMNYLNCWEMIREMYIEWEINKEELKSYSLEEFNEDGDIWGFMILNLGDYQLGCLSDIFDVDEESNIDKELLEGDDLIAYNIDNLIKCGISLLKNKSFKFHLLDYNKVEFHVVWDEDVKIEMIDYFTKELFYFYSISFDDLVAEIKTDYTKYINDIKEINEVILQSKMLKNTSRLYDEFLNLLDQKASD